MPADIEKVLLNAYPADAQYFRPDPCHGTLQFASRLVIFNVFSVLFRGGQLLAIQLPIAVQRQVAERYDHGRHVLRQLRTQKRAQLRGVRVAGFPPDHIRRQLLVAIPFADHNGSLPYVFVCPQRRFNFAEFDAHAADFDLLVHSSQVLQLAVAQIAHPVSGAVEARPRLPAQRIGQVSFRGQAGTAPVAAPDRHSSQIQLPHRSSRHRPELCIEHIHLHVADRSSDRHRVALLFRLTAPTGHIHRRFRRPVQIVQLHSRQPLLQLLSQLRRQRFPATDHSPQVPAPLRQPFLLYKRLQHRRHEMHRRHLLARQQIQQIPAVLMPARPRHHQPRSIHQWPEKLPHRHVETERRLLHHTLPLSQPKRLLHPLQAVADPGLRVHRPLRPSRRARRVNHIRQLPAPHHPPPRPAISAALWRPISGHCPSTLSSSRLPGCPASSASFFSSRSCVSTTRTPASANMNRFRSSGYPGSTGTYAAPAFSTPSSATTNSTERSITTPTYSSRSTPLPTR